MIDIIIIGAGTAGLSAAIYGVRAGKEVLVLEQTAYGGQIINASEIENYPGIANISGFDFATGLYKQATDLGAKVKFEDVLRIEHISAREQVVYTKGTQYTCHAIILATGAKNRPLGLIHETEWIGAGISYCATCDGAFYRGRTVAVAGGGNTALEDAIFLSNYCKKVYIIHRRNEFRGEKKLQDQLAARENVEFVLNVHLDELIGTDHLEAVAVSDKETGEKRILEVAALFVAIGQMPENARFADVVDLDLAGYIIAGEDTKTSVEGIFAAGDCRTKTVRQLVTAANDGAIAALGACEYC